MSRQSSRSRSGLEGARVVAVDWSGDARAPRRGTRIAEVADGSLVDVRPGGPALALAEELGTLAAAASLVVGLDFAFGFPEWFARERIGAHVIDDVWAAAERDGEAWLARCEPPFWGRPRRPRPPADPARPQLRRTDHETPPAKSPFQIGGAGAVGTGSIRGMPLLRLLRAAGFAIWPFDDAPASLGGERPGLVLEIYPRALAPPGLAKRDPGARAAHVAAHARIPMALRDAVAASEHAFDATIGALALSAHLSELAALRADPDYALEGAIWRPVRQSSRRR
jgi:hypothetical protein